MTDTCTCEFCATTYTSGKDYENCKCAGRQAFNAGRSVPYSTIEHESAAAEARDRGMAFIVDGKHVNADRVFILSVPDTIGPISNMRTAKVEAKKALAELTMTLKVDADVATLKALDGCIALLRGCYEALASNHGVVRSETRLAIGKFLEQMAQGYVPVDPAAEKIDLPQHTLGGIVITTMRDGAEHVDNSNCKFAQGGAACSLWCGDSHCRPAPLVINGILVTDPALASPITDDIRGVSTACGVCGALHTNDGLFCNDHLGDQ